MSQTRQRSTTMGIVVAVALLLGVGIGYFLAPSTQTDCLPNPAATSSQVQGGDAVILDLFNRQISDVQVQGSGTVTRLLADDLEGSRHQKFILALEGGHTLLVAHNIDLAPRLDGIKVGQQVRFYGEYVYTEEGGTIHWTHHDPAGRHIHGWLEWNGRTYT
ncbi:MAG: DUF3465 domain-containing protein [Propionibacteriaceae bacterium]|nr:DUF3465 domain-containing protein [Propionibacteriaceae bacterium]